MLSFLIISFISKNVVIIIDNMTHKNHHLLLKLLSYFNVEIAKTGGKIFYMHRDKDKQR